MILRLHTDLLAVVVHYLDIDTRDHLFQTCRKLHCQRHDKRLWFHPEQDTIPRALLDSLPQPRDRYLYLQARSRREVGIGSEAYLSMRKCIKHAVLQGNVRLYQYFRSFTSPCCSDKVMSEEFIPYALRSQSWPMLRQFLDRKKLHPALSECVCLPPGTPVARNLEHEKLFSDVPPQQKDLIIKLVARNIVGSKYDIFEHLSEIGVWLVRFYKAILNGRIPNLSGTPERLCLYMAVISPVIRYSTIEVYDYVVQTYHNPSSAIGAQSNTIGIALRYGRLDLVEHVEKLTGKDITEYDCTHSFYRGYRRTTNRAYYEALHDRFVEKAMTDSRPIRLFEQLFDKRMSPDLLRKTLERSNPILQSFEKEEFLQLFIGCLHNPELIDVVFEFIGNARQDAITIDIDNGVPFVWNRLVPYLEKVLSIRDVIWVLAEGTYFWGMKQSEPVILCCLTNHIKRLLQKCDLEERIESLNEILPRIRRANSLAYLRLLDELCLTIPRKHRHKLKREDVVGLNESIRRLRRRSSIKTIRETTSSQI